MLGQSKSETAGDKLKDQWSAEQIGRAGKSGGRMGGRAFGRVKGADNPKTHAGNNKRVPTNSPLIDEETAREWKTASEEKTLRLPPA